MAASHQQRALVRKVIYTVSILALFTLSLLHRRLVVEPSGDKLLLREVARGEVELTSSAVRLSLTGSRGLAVTFLWAAALKKQEQHEWNELELMVSSITKLQPYFISPWLFQSWNLSFNVAVECDRARDKYYYISRGLEMLAEGERRNHKPPAPGNPDMRYYLGFTYQLKIGTSDEKNTMRCLFDLSCIDPVQRDPDRLWASPDQGRVVKLQKFKDFCEKYPRLVRRLRDKLDCDTPDKVVQFLMDNKDVPSRFKKPEGGRQQPTPLQDPPLQFPVLPPRLKDRWPDPKSADMTTETIDVFLVTRTWLEYAQEDLPEPNREAGEPDPPFNPLKKRKPRYIDALIFRSTPARAQAYIAETLEEEGFFDAEGWVIQGKSWFDQERGPNDPEVRVGTQTKYHAAAAWEKTYQDYKDFGSLNGLYFPPGERAALEKQADFFRKKYMEKEFDKDPSSHESQKMKDSMAANKKLGASQRNRNLTNFDVHLAQANAERQAQTLQARKLFFQAEQWRALGDPVKALAIYEEAWPLWIQVLVAHPEFANLFTLQEDTYDLQINYLILGYKQRPEVFKAVAIGLAQMGTWPYPAHLEDALPDSFKDNLKPYRMARGVLDSTMYFAGFQALPIKRFLGAWTAGPQFLAGPGRLLVPTEAMLLDWECNQYSLGTLYPGHEGLLLTRYFTRDTDIPPFWRPFVDQKNVQEVRKRLGLDPR